MARRGQQLPGPVSYTHLDVYKRQVLATQSALAADGDLLDEQQRAEVDQLVRELQAARSLSDAAAIEAVTKALAQGTEAFAALRMNRGIQKALSGKNIASI